jgi:hypothetical protein
MVDIFILWIFIIVLLVLFLIAHFFWDKYTSIFYSGNENIEEIWKNEKLVYLNSCIISPDINMNDFNKCRSFHNPDIEIKNLPKEHPLFGEKGVFAKRKIHKYDIIGEYTGIIIKNLNNKNEIKNRYICGLFGHDKGIFLIDAEKYGNETRFINSNINISPSPNIVYRYANIDTYPRMLLIATEDIEIGKELLGDYGEDHYKDFNIHPNNT